jgi:hypothetical protein
MQQRLYDAKAGLQTIGVQIAELTGGNTSVMFVL